MHTAREELIKLQLSPRSLVENIAILLDEVLETKESQDRNRTRNASVTEAEAQLRVSNLDDPYEINITKGSVDKAEQYLENKYNELKQSYNRDMKLHLRYINELKNSLEQEMKLYKKEKEAKRQIMELNVNLMNEMQEVKKTLAASQKENKAF